MDQLSDVDLIVLLVNDAVTEQASWITQRAEFAAECARMFPMAMVAVSGGKQRVVPVQDEFRLLEDARTYAVYLMDLGVDPSRILCNASARDTVESAIDVYTRYVVPMKLRHVLVVTSKHRTSRATHVFERVNYLHGTPSSLHVFGCRDDAIPRTLLPKLVKIEADSEKVAREILAAMTNLRELTLWLHTEHPKVGVFRPQQENVLQESMV